MFRTPRSSALWIAIPAACEPDQPDVSDFELTYAFEATSFEEARR